MRIKKINFLLLFSLLFLLVTGCGGRIPTGGGDDGGANVLVRVIDKQISKPIQQAKVSLKKDNVILGAEQLTDENGETVFKNVPSGDGYIAFVNNALGYKSGASPVIKVTGNTESNVQLDRLGNGDGSGLIAGSVKDRGTKEPISRLTVTYAGPKKGLTTPVLTDENGTFMIDGLVSGNYLLTFSKSGYTRVQKSITVIEGQSSNIETIFLAKSGAQSTGNYLISLSGARRVVELDKSGRVLWSYNQLKSIESAVRLETGSTVVSDSNSSKVVEISKTGSVVNSFGAGAIFSSLKYPSWVDSLAGNTILVTDNGANKIVEFTNGKAVWSYSTGLSRPRSAVYLSNGNILVTDQGNRRVLEISKQGQIVWSFDQHMDKPVHAVRLANGNTLITDAGYSRVIEVSQKGEVVWWFAGANGGGSSGSNSTGIGNVIGDGNNAPAPDSDGADIPNPTAPAPGDTIDDGSEPDAAVSNVRTARNGRMRIQTVYNAYDNEQAPPAPGPSLLFPRSAVRLSNGNTLIADTGNNRIVEVSREKQIVWELGNLPRPVSVERL